MDDISREVNAFIKEVAQYQEEYPWLLLISMPKIVILSSSLNHESLFKIVCELNHIMQSRSDCDHNAMIIKV